VRGGASPRARRAVFLRRLLACAALAAAPAGADVLEIPAQRDATLIESAEGGLANGAGPVLFAGRTSQSRESRRRGLLYFDVAAAIPAGSIVTEAALELVLSPSNAEPAELQLHRVRASWGEGESAAAGGGGAPATPGDVTWIHRFWDDVFWARAGGDFEAAPSASAWVADAGVYAFDSTPALREDVQAWLDAPQDNFGWILIGDESRPSTSKRFFSRESEDASVWPLLRVRYAAVCEQPGLAAAARGLCLAYCEALDCDAAPPHGSERACRALARGYARESGGAAPPCE